MRITNSMMTNSLLTNLNRNLNRLNHYQMQLSTEKRIVNLSDDPVGVITAMQAKTKMGQLRKYQDTIATANSWVQTTDDAIYQMQELVQNVMDQANQYASSKTPEDKEKGAIYVEQMMEELAQIGNTSVGDQYVFGGFNTAEPPFNYDKGTGKLTYNGIEMYPNPDAAATADLEANKDQIIEFEIGYGLRTQVTFTGVKLMGTGEDNVFGMMADLAKSLRNDDSEEEIGGYIKKMQDAQSHFLTLEAEVGGREVRLEMMESRYKDETLNYETRLSEVEDIDLAEVYLQWSTAQSVYQAALQTGAKIIQPTLMDYIR